PPRPSHRHAGNRGTPQLRQERRRERGAFSTFPPARLAEEHASEWSQAGLRTPLRAASFLPILAQDLTNPAVLPLALTEFLFAARADGTVAVTFERLAAPIGSASW